MVVSCPKRLLQLGEWKLESGAFNSFIFPTPGLLSGFHVPLLAEAPPPTRPVSAPCRKEGVIPELDDKSAQQPVPGKVRISEVAVQSRLRRIFTPNIDGKYKVPMTIVQQWQSGKKKARKSLEQIFQSCGFCPDRGPQIFW